jgi:WD40 repeat protein
MSVSQDRFVDLVFHGVLPGIDGRVFDIAFAPHSPTLVVSDRSGLGLYDSYFLIQTDYINSESIISSLEYSQDGDYLLASGTTNVYLISSSSGATVQRYEGTEGTFVDNYKKVWTKRSTYGSTVGTGPPVYGCWNAESAKITKPPVSFGGYSDTPTGNFFFYNRFDELSRSDRIDDGPPDSCWVLVKKWQSNEVCLMNTQTKKVQDISTLIDDNQTVLGAIFSNDFSILALQISEEEKERIVFIDVGNLTKLSSCNGTILMGRFRPQNDLFAVRTPQSVTVLDVHNGKTVEELELDLVSVTCVDWSADGRYIAFGTSGGNVGIWEVKKMEL